MSSVPVGSEIEVLDLRHFSARQLRPVLECEADVWRERLFWDYRSSIELLLRYLESRMLQGFAALDRGRICGYAFCVYEGTKAVIGDAFAVSHETIGGETLHGEAISRAAISRAAISCETISCETKGDAATTRVLLTHMLEMLRYSPEVDRVESQLLLFDAGEFADLFAGPEFTLYPRLFLHCDLGQKGHGPEPQGRPAAEAGAAVLPSGLPPGLPPELQLSPWMDGDYQAAGELIYTCYVGHSDADINDQYRSLHGSLRFLHNIVRFPGCGVFQGQFSWMLRDSRSGELLGMVLCSQVAATVSHITQICIARQYRGRGLGRILMDHCLESLRNAGFEAVTLTVTEGNHRAVKLYERFGFTQIHRFDAMVMDTRAKPR